MNHVMQELAALRAEMARQQADIAELKGRLGDTPAKDPGTGSTTRRQLLVAGAAAVAGGAASLPASPAEAANGQPLLLGRACENEATAGTSLTYTGASGGGKYCLHVRHGAHGCASGFSETSATLISTTAGTLDNSILTRDLSGHGHRAAVKATTRTGYAIRGIAEQPGGWGVYGESPTLGVFGYSNGPGSTGVRAASFGGTALLVEGVHRTTRAGTAIIAAGQHTLFVALSPITSTSLVFANLQPYNGTRAVAGCRIRAAGQIGFFIKLTAATPAAVRVAWFVVDMVGAGAAAAPAEELREAKLSPLEREQMRRDDAARRDPDAAQ